jgi:hypothetical protein
MPTLRIVNACVIINNEHLMCLMHVQLKTEFLICHIRKLYNAKRTATFVIMHDTTFSDHIRVRMWKVMKSAWHRK